jgi:hypothetical protein
MDEKNNDNDELWEQVMCKKCSHEHGSADCIDCEQMREVKRVKYLILAGSMAAYMVVTYFVWG